MPKLWRRQNRTEGKARIRFFGARRRRLSPPERIPFVRRRLLLLLFPNFLCLHIPLIFLLNIIFNLSSWSNDPSLAFYLNNFLHLLNPIIFFVFWSRNSYTPFSTKNSLALHSSDYVFFLFQWSFLLYYSSNFLSLNDQIMFLAFLIKKFSYSSFLWSHNPSILIIFLLFIPIIFYLFIQVILLIFLIQVSFIFYYSNNLLDLPIPIIFFVFLIL